MAAILESTQIRVEARSREARADFVTRHLPFPPLSLFVMASAESQEHLSSWFDKTADKVKEDADWYVSSLSGLEASLFIERITGSRPHTLCRGGTELPMHLMRILLVLCVSSLLGVFLKLTALCRRCSQCSRH